MGVLKLVLGLLFAGYLLCLGAVLADAIVAAVLPWLYHEDGSSSKTWQGISPMMYCSFTEYAGNTAGSCKSKDDIGCESDAKDMVCVALNDGAPALALYLIATILGVIGALLTLFELCCGEGKRRPVRIVAYIFFIVMFVFCIAATAIEAGVCKDWKDAWDKSSLISADKYWETYTGQDSGITCIVMAVPAAALYIIFVLLRNKLGK